jgi:hypothetical protein
MNKSILILSAFSLIILIGCGKKQIKQGYEITDGAIAEQAPAWVNKGSGAFEDSNGKRVFYGVGMITGVKNKSLAVQAADQRARAEIAKAMNNYVSVLVRDYMISTSAIDMQGPSEEQDVSVALKGLTRANLKGAIIVDHWLDPEDNTMFSLARLEMDDFKQDLAQSQLIDDNLRDFVRENADNAFDELAEAETIK